MTEPKIVIRWLGLAAMLQSTLIFLVYLFLTESLTSLRSNLTDVLYRNHVATQLVDLVNQQFSSLLSLTLWILIAGIALTCVGYGLLRSVIMKSGSVPNPSKDLTT